MTHAWTHAWCKSPARDEAVRAAEDGRTAPLQTLEEAIVQAFGFDEASAQRVCDEVKSWPEDVQKDCRFFLGDSLEQGVERLQALVEVWRFGKGLLAARYPGMIPKSVSESSAPDQENKGDGMGVTQSLSADEGGEEMEQGNFAHAAERSSTVSKTGEGQSGLRTERVTLEVTHGNPWRINTWEWAYILRLGAGESVRVVSDEERQWDVASLRADVAKLENDKQFLVERLRPLNDAILAAFDDNGDRMSSLAALRVLIDQRDAAIREREELRKSWLRSEESGTRLLAQRNAALDDADGLRKRVAELEAASGGGEQPRGWLTDRDRKTLIDAAVFCSGKGERGTSEAIEWILARSTPPEVVLPGLFALSLLGDRLLVEAQVKDALAAAGVAVKEVGK